MTTLTHRIFVLFIGFGLLGCGSDSGEERNGGGLELMTDGGSANSGPSCFTASECPAGQYCRSDEPENTAEGRCTAQEEEAGPCVAGADCVPGLFCKKGFGEVRGMCTVFPEACIDEPTCMCAIETCPQLPGSTCSVGSLDNPSETMLVVCAD